MQSSVRLDKEMNMFCQTDTHDVSVGTGGGTIRSPLTPHSRSHRCCRIADAFGPQYPSRHPPPGAHSVPFSMHLSKMSAAKRQKKSFAIDLSK